MDNFIKILQSSVKNTKKFNLKYLSPIRCGGINYVLTLYDISYKNCEFNIKNKNRLVNNKELHRQITYLLNPDFQNKYNKKNNNIDDMTLINTFPTKYAEIASTWSGVALIREFNKQSEEDLYYLIEKQIEIQGAWYLYDNISQNIRYNNYNLIELRHFENLIDFIHIDMGYHIEGNTSTHKAEVMDSLIKTSKLETVYNKSKLILNGRIKLEEAKKQEDSRINNNKIQKLLISLTVISTYEPIGAIIDDLNTKNYSDFKVNVTILLVLLIIYIGIIKCIGDD